MKKLICLCLAAILVFSSSACTNQKTNGQSINDFEALYESFISNEIFAMDKNGQTLSISHFKEKETNDYQSKYAIYDMNGDGVPELCIKTVFGLYFFTVKDKNIVFWREDTSYSQPLNNMAILSERTESAPEHTQYVYTVVGYSGNELLKIEFCKYAQTEFQGEDYPEKYFINNVEVSKSVYEELTTPLLDVGTEKIEWFPLSK